jgi:hypothetical protein
MSSAFLAVRAYKRRRGKTEQKNGERRGAMTRLGQPPFAQLLAVCLVTTPQTSMGRVIWLILPVVIRSSQRLSHACLSINIITLKLRMAHYISYIYLIVPYYLDNRSNSRANTCVNTPNLLG